MPPKVYLEVPNGDFRAMPATAAGLAGIKWVNSHPGNPQRCGLPTVMAMMIVNDPATARPLAILDGTSITGLRTASAAAVATRRLARPDACTLGVVGCGVQAANHIRAIGCVLSLDRVLLADARTEQADRVAGEFPDLPCEVVEVERACRADVICTLTPSHQPIVRDAWGAPRNAYQRHGRRRPRQTGTRKRIGGARARFCRCLGSGRPFGGNQRSAQSRRDSGRGRFVARPALRRGGGANRSRSDHDFRFHGSGDPGHGPGAPGAGCGAATWDWKERGVFDRRRNLLIFKFEIRSTKSETIKKSEMNRGLSGFDSDYD